MSIEQVVSNAVVEKDGIHFLSDHAKFGYNDGDRIESYILNVIRNAKDISSDSRELETHIRDWPSLYHFSRERSLAYQSLNITRDMRVLEVGCGCGSITRLLGERSDHVVALEGSPRRATITRARTRDLNSVTVLCASFEDVKFTQQFDLVVCNGVLEYASLFVKHENPHRRMIELLSALVAPGGSLVVAIENKLGLRYFSSSKEEHTNTMYDGLEGYPRQQMGARTFGAKELKWLFEGIFAETEFLLPLPDYKLPVALVRQDLIERADCSELFANTARHDLGARVDAKIHERLLWREIGKSGQLLEFSNSFFVIAGQEKTRLLSEDWLGEIYSIKRNPWFCTRTRIMIDTAGKVRTDKLSQASHNVNAGTVPIEHNVTAAQWVDGPSIHTNAVRALMKSGKISLEDRLRQVVSAWWQVVTNVGGTGDRLDGAIIDLNWQNAIVASTGIVFIDREWVFKGHVSRAWLFYRVATKFLEDELPYIHRWNADFQGMTVYRLVMAMARITGSNITIASLLEAARSDLEFQYAITGRQFSAFRSYYGLFESIKARRKRRAFDAVSRSILGIAKRLLKLA